MKLANFNICKRLRMVQYNGEYDYFAIPKKYSVQCEYMLFEDIIGFNTKEQIDKYYAAPYLEHICDWLREKHNMNISVKYRHNMSRIGCPWTYSIQIMGGYSIYAGRKYYASYESALESAIEHALDEIENRNK